MQDYASRNKIVVVIATLASFFGLLLTAAFLTILLAPRPQTGRIALAARSLPAPVPIEATPSVLSSGDNLFADPSEVWMSYEESQKAADRVYQFQRVTVKGKIAGVRRDVIHGYPQVLFAVRGKHSSGELMCVFDTSSASDREKALKLETGNVVNISGTCTGKEDNRIILIDSEIRER
jgi:hypothetical protein